MGKKYYSIFHMIPAPHWKQLFHERICMGVEIWCSSKIFSVSCGNIVIFKGKVWANIRVFRCPRFQLNGKAWIGRVSFLNQVNRLSESVFRVFQNLVGEHLILGVPVNQKCPRFFVRSTFYYYSLPQKILYIFVEQTTQNWGGPDEK